ncbi:galactose-1-phosphate uridylyltransferase [Parvularcula lutaonensis]|nr:galactose-1-phosphate uridylyltransferase [Parvularcula lutaonensis]
MFLYGFAKPDGVSLPEGNDPVAKGGELRWHPFRREWNVYAAHRQNRTFKPSSAEDPLAPSKPGGAVTEIPFETFEVAVFGNKFTSLHPEAPDPPEIPGVSSQPAVGACEVVVYTPEQTGSLYTVGQERRRLLLSAWNDRYEALFQQGCAFVMPFESRGEEVGVTLHHPHGQIYGFGEVPQVQRQMASAFDDGFSLERLLPQWSEYSVDEAGGVSAFCPPFARFPFEVWLTPRRRVPGPWDFSEEESDGFAHLLGEVTRRYDRFFGRDTAYMLTLHAAPKGCEQTFHFTAQFYPILRAPGRVKFLASVEQGTGVFTVDVMPEEAARTLRAQ